MNEKRKRMARAVALILAGLMLFSTLIGGLATMVMAAVTPRDKTYASLTDIEIKEKDRIERDSEVTISFHVNKTPAVNMAGTVDFQLTQSYWRTGATMTVTALADGCDITVTGLVYNSLNVRTMLTFTNIMTSGSGGGSGQELFPDTDIVVTIPESYFSGRLINDGDNSGGSGGGSTTPDEEEYTYTSNVVFESASVTRGGTAVESIDKDSDPFDLEITYTDTGLRSAELNHLMGTAIDAFFSPGGSFATSGTTRGTIRRMTNTRSRYPRFTVTFSNLTYTGTGNEAAFQVYYLFDYLKDPVKGEGKAVISEAEPEGEDKDDDKLGVAVPKIIIDSYSYGEDTIVAGKDFPLNFSLRNTSAQVPLENVVITLTPASNEAAKQGPGLIVASSSNTIYLPELAAGASVPYSMAFQARPDAEVTSHIIQISFSYEYVDTVKKSRESAEMTESIAIPVSQLDRFSVDPITENAFAEVGREGYLTVNLANLGKSTTYNISLSIRCDNPAVTAPTERCDNLEAGAFDSVDLILTSTEPGEFTGDVVVSYEDDNGNQKELTTPFVLMVEEPWFPPADELPPPDIDAELDAPGPSALSVVLCTIGGLAIAAPIALYLGKRVRFKGLEDFDETF